MANFGGATDDDIKLWNTYLYWARAELAPRSTSDLTIGQPAYRISHKRAKALRAIVLTAFVLEYRIKRVYEEVGVTFDHNDTLGRLLQNMRKRLEACQRLDGKGKIRLPSTWPSLYEKLLRLKKARNNIAHAKYLDLRTTLSLPPSRMLTQAQGMFNSVVRTIRVLNVATGYDTRTPKQRRQNYSAISISLLEGV
jgi:hypothetical protein